MKDEPRRRSRVLIGVQLPIAVTRAPVLVIYSCAPVLKGLRRDSKTHKLQLSQRAPLFQSCLLTEIVATLSLSPRKYLRYLGWCVLGVIGVLNDEEGNEIELDGELDDRGVYHYILPDQTVLAHAVDLEVIKQRSQVSSETTGTHKDFRTRVLERDGCCVWTGMYGIGMHIIPYERGDKACSHCSFPCMLTKLVYCSSGSNASLTTGHITKTSTTFGTASTLIILFIIITLTHEKSLSLKFVSPFLPIDYH